MYWRIFMIVNKHKRVSAHQHIAVTVYTSYDCWITEVKINGFITWEQTGSNALPALQQLWGQRLLPAQWSLTRLGGTLSEGDLLLDGRVAEGVCPATELRGIWVVLKVTGWSPRWGVTRRVALQGEQIMNRVSDELDPTTSDDEIIFNVRQLSLSTSQTSNSARIHPRQKQAIYWDMNVQPSNFRQSKAKQLTWHQLHQTIDSELTQHFPSPCPVSVTSPVRSGWVGGRVTAHFVICCMLIVCVTEPHHTHMSRWRWNAAQWRFLAAVYCDGYRKGLSLALFLTLFPVLVLWQFLNPCSPVSQYTAGPGNQ